MTKIINDSLDVTLKIGSLSWLVIEAKVVLSQTETPNYVDMIITPNPNQPAAAVSPSLGATFGLPFLPDNVDQLLGKKVTLKADNELISNRDSDASEDSLLFKGRLGNISPTGKNTFEATAYVPSQQVFGESDGGLVNSYIDLEQSKTSYEKIYNETNGTEYDAQTIDSVKLANRVVQKLGISEYEIQLQDGGKKISGEEGSFRGAYKQTLFFKDKHPTVKRALRKIRKSCRAQWWFDKEGVFYIGIPEPTKHKLKYIVDADAGKTTPPYQSVRVIGSGAASVKNGGYNRTNMEIEDKIVVEGNLAKKPNGDPIVNINPDGELNAPTFDYKNLEISSDKEARDTAQKIVEDLAKQQSDGKVTVVGFPEVVPYDGIVMPNGKKGPYPKDDIRYRQPMGGKAYGVYKVVHKLNNSDGFITDIHCSGVIGETATTVSSAEATNTYNVDADAVEEEIGIGDGSGGP